MIEYKIKTFGNGENIFLIRENHENFNLSNYLTIDKSMINMKVDEIDELITFLQEYKHANQN